MNRYTIPNGMNEKEFSNLEINFLIKYKSGCSLVLVIKIATQFEDEYFEMLNLKFEEIFGTVNKFDGDNRVNRTHHMP